MTPLSHDQLPYLVLKGSLFLVMGNWGNRLYLLYAEGDVPRSRFADLSLVAATKQGYYWASVAPTNLTLARPQGVIVGINWPNTVFKFVQWACSSHGINLTPQLVSRMVARATGDVTLASLPDPLEFFRYDWLETSEGSNKWTQRKPYEGNGELYRIIKPTGWLTSLPRMRDKFQGIQVLQAMPARQAIETVLIGPYRQHAQSL